jgi:hypothetical protein
VQNKCWSKRKVEKDDGKRVISIWIVELVWMIAMRLGKPGATLKLYEVAVDEFEGTVGW